MSALRRFLPLFVILVLAATIFALGGHRYLSFDAVHSGGERFQAFVDAHWVLSLLLMMVAFALLTASVTPGVFFVTILAGYLFGPWVGGVATAFAATVGALAVYWVASSAARDWLRRRIENGEGLLARICAGIDRNTFSYVLAARLVVSVPFHLINLAAGLMQVRLKPYLAATFLGVLPAHLIYCWIGSRLDELNGEEDIQQIVARFALPLAGVAFLSILLPVLMRVLNRHSAHS